MGDVHYIVDKLNVPPFSYGISLVAFSEKGPNELLQLLSDVFTRISPKHQNLDVSNEAPEQTAGRLLEFLKIIKYKPTTDPNTFRQLLVAGDRDAIYPVLKWVLPQPQLLEKRAFVGYYLSFPDMPEEMNFDPDIVDTKEDMKQMHQHFIEIHRQCEQVRSMSRDTQAIKAKIKGLEDEKERLGDKVAKAKERASSLPEQASFLEACSALRRQQGEEVTLSQQLQSQRSQLERAEAAYQKAMGRLRELQSSATDGSSTRLLDGLQEEVAGLRFQVSEKFPKEMERKQKRLQALQEVLQNNVNNEVDLQRLQQQAASLQQDIQNITDRRAAAEKAQQGNKAFLQVKQAQQMLTVVARKRDDIQAKLERLQEKKAALTAEFERRAVSEQQPSISGNQGAFSEEEWRQKYESMKARLPTYKKMKKELGDLEAELLVLAHTLEVLTAQEQDLTLQVEKTERSHGVQGFAKTVTTLEKVSEAKSTIDEMKGATLEEISRTVSEIIAAIKDRKDKLAPKIKQLHAARQALQELESQHAEKKGAYDAAVAAAESKTASLEGEVEALKVEISENESKYHLLNCQLHMVDTNIKRLTTSTNMERLRDKYQNKVAEAEELMKELKEKQRSIKDTHSSGLSQIEMMTDLIKLLQLKISLHQGNGFSAPAPQSFNTATANVMVL